MTRALMDSFFAPMMNSWLLFDEMSSPGLTGNENLSLVDPSC